MYKVPTIGSYPQGLSIDDKGMIWFSEIFGKRIGVLDPSKVIDNTTSGIYQDGKVLLNVSNQDMKKQFKRKYPGYFRDVYD